MNPAHHLQQGLSELQLPHDSKTIDKFMLYLDFLKTENKKHNLTALRTDSEIIDRLFLDSLLLLAAHDIHNQPPRRIIDVGTGAGFPGIPLALLCSQSRFLLLEATAKKCNFLSALIAKLELRNVQILNQRAEIAARQPDLRENFDLAVSRAVAKTPALAELLLPFLKIGGIAVMYKSADAHEEIELAQDAIQLLGAKLQTIELVKNPLSHHTTSLAFMEKTNPTPDKYPRRPGIPQKRPLL